MSCTRPVYGTIYAAHGPEDFIDMSKAAVLQSGSAFRAFIYPIIIEADQAVCFIHIFCRFLQQLTLCYLHISSSLEHYLLLHATAG